MEKRIFGVILTILGVGGLIGAAYNFIQKNAENVSNIKSIAVFGILGLIFFFAGIALIRGTKDRPT